MVSTLLLTDNVILPILTCLPKKRLFSSSNFGLSPRPNLLIFRVRRLGDCGLSVPLIIAFLFGGTCLLQTVYVKHFKEFSN
jgi:hypothetical protein